MANESLVQSKVLKYLKKLEMEGHPIYYEHRQAMGLSYKDGVPDLYCVYNGIHIEIEMKDVGGDVRTRQEAFERKCYNRGIIYIRPDTFEEFKTFFETKIIPRLKK